MSLASPRRKMLAEKGRERYGMALFSYQNPRAWQMLEVVVPEIQQASEEATHWTGDYEGGRQEWLGGRSPKQLLELVTTGAPMKAAPVELPDIGQDTSGVGATPGPYGAAWDVGALLAGLPNCAVQFQTIEGANRIVRIVVNGFISWNIDTETYARRGQAIASLVETLRVYGFEAEVTLLVGWDRESQECAPGWAENAHGFHLTEVEIVGPGEYLDPQRVAWMIGDIGAIRGLLYPYLGATLGLYNCAYSPELNEEIKKHVEADATAIYLDPTVGRGDAQIENFATNKKARAWVLAQVDKVRRACRGGD